MDWHQVSFPEDVDPLDEPKAMIREAETIYKKTGFPKDFCVFQEINHNSSCVIYFSPVATRYCQEDGLFESYRKIHPCRHRVNSRNVCWIIFDVRTHTRTCAINNRAKFRRELMLSTAQPSLDLGRL